MSCFLRSPNERYVGVDQIGSDKAALIVREAFVSLKKQCLPDNLSP